MKYIKENNNIIIKMNKFNNNKQKNLNLNYMIKFKKINKILIKKENKLSMIYILINKIFYKKKYVYKIYNDYIYIYFQIFNPLV